MNNRSLISLVILLVFIFSTAQAKQSNYCDEYGLGWNFYCQDKKREERVEKQEKIEEEDYSQKLATIKKTLEDKKAKAVIYPTEENIKDYMAYQKMVLDRSGYFADQWRRVIWKTPDLDYTLQRPVSKIGKESWVDERNVDIASTIKNINDRYGIFFLFRSDCPHCHRYSPILKSFQVKYGINIMAVSMDGGAITGWDKIMINRGEIEKMGIAVKAVPATILFDKETREVIPVGFGVLSHSDLEERIYAQTKLEVGNDF